MITVAPGLSYKKNDFILQLVLLLALAYEISSAPAFQVGERLTHIAIIAILLALGAVFGAFTLMGALYLLSQRTSPKLAADVLMAGACVYMGFIAQNGTGDWLSLSAWIAWYGTGRGAFEVFGRARKWWCEAQHRRNDKDD